MVSASTVQIPSSGSLVIQGDPGSGKTTWLESAVCDEFEVVRFRAFPDEAEVPFAMLGKRFGSRDGLLNELAGRDRTVLCLADDLQWADEESLAALTYAARRAVGRSLIMLLATSARTTPAGIAVHRLVGLDRGGAASVLGSFGIPGEKHAELIRISQGNPQALIDLASGSHGLRDAYARRLALLPQSTRWLLLLAAAEPEMRTNALIEAAALSGVDILALSPAEEDGLIYAGAHEVMFCLPLLREHVYDLAHLAQRRAAHQLLSEVTALGRLRRAVHRAAASAGPDPGLVAELEQAAGEADGYGAASAAWEQAALLTDSPAEAAGKLVTAARCAWQSGSPRRALTLLESADQIGIVAEGRRELLAGEIEMRSGATLSTLDRLLAAADRYAETDHNLALMALVRAGEAVCFSGDHERFAEITHRAQRLESRPETELLLEHLRGFGATFAGRHAEGAISLRKVLALAEPMTDPGALTCASAAALLLGDDQAAQRFSVRATTAARACGELATLPLALEMQATAEYWLGRYESAAATCRDGLAVARECGQDNYAGDHQALLAVLAAIRGERETCLELLDTLAIAPGAGQISRPTAFSRWARSIVDLIAGRPDDAVTRLLSIADPVTGHGHVVVLTMATPWLVEAAVRSGDPAAAQDAFAGFDRWATATGDGLRQALAARCHALLAPRGEAEDHFREALRWHSTAEADFERARTEFLFGQELRRARRSRAAREHLHLALETFHHLHLPAWVEQAQAELRAAGTTVAPPSSTQSLTAQQFQIARLVADGATNREIAAQLFLSPRTIDHHMRNIFSRLGIRSRVELTRLLR